jgi:predicted deacylase
VKLAVVACLHGNEPFGREVINKLEKLDLDNVKFLIANKKALELNKRFVDCDLNRSFPGRADSELYEERLAHNIMKQLRDYDYVIDLHSSTSNTPPITIVTRRDCIRLAEKTGIKRICLMSPELAKGKALIDHVKCGISLEVGNHNNPTIADTAFNLIKNALINLGILEGEALMREPDYFEIYDFEHDMNLDLKDFEKYEDYYPVLVDEKSYDNIKCLKARKIFIKHLF